MRRTRKRLLTIVASSALAAGGLVPLAVSANAVSGAIFTTINSVDGPAKNTCKNTGTINCNIYTDKSYVWLNGGPSAGAISDGTYFFVVLEPGGQSNPNDGSAHNLSDTNAAGGDGGATGDAYTNRVFTVSGGVITGYSGTHDSTDRSAKNGGDQIRLMPYDNTSNPGGVYIAAICKIGSTYDPVTNPVHPGDCKYDAFKVQSGKGGAQVNAVFSGSKIRDTDADGVHDPGEPGLSGWTIHVYSGTDPSTWTELTDVSGNPIVTLTDGSWTFTSANFAAGSAPTAYTICEQNQTGWLQTGPVTGSLTLGDFGATDIGAGAVVAITGHGNCYQFTNLTSGGLPSAGSLDFLNTPQEKLTVGKYNDANMNGRYDAGEAGIQGWEIQILDSSSHVVQTLTTDANGAFTSDPLSAGTYTVRELTSTSTPGTYWLQTGNTTNQSSDTTHVTLNSDKTYTVVITGTATTAITGLLFGNVCVLSPGGHTLGWWGNKNGNAMITTTQVTGLDALNLRNLNGTNFDPGSATEFSNWVTTANGSNMANMLSAQMATTWLDLQNSITVDVTGVDPNNPTFSISQLIAYANSLLANPITSGTFTGLNGSVTTGSSALRTEQNRLEAIFDQINNSGTFTAGSPSSCGTPTFS